MANLEPSQKEKPLVISEYGLLYNNVTICQGYREATGKRGNCSIGDSNDAPAIPISSGTRRMKRPHRIHDRTPSTSSSTRRTCDLGYTADDCRLVQKWNWYSLDDKNGNFNEYNKLIDPNTGEITSTGRAFPRLVNANFDELTQIAAGKRFIGWRVRHGVRRPLHFMSTPTAAVPSSASPPLATLSPRKSLVARLRELLRYRSLIYNLVVRELKARYKNSALGFLWSLLNPLGMMLVFWVVFDQVFQSDIEQYPIFLLTGLLRGTSFRRASWAARAASSATAICSRRSTSRARCCRLRRCWRSWLTSCSPLSCSLPR